ncbi:hypothetical protein [Candidatus Chlorohelix sp.]|uniref:hypothetical protein n=1 Tax=Candidatus Chlorohelix sp. TaxID=3139201 RepID=UPI00306E4453
MSYRPSVPPTSNPNYISPGRVKNNRRGVPWLAGCGLLGFGFLLGVVGLVIGALFWFGSPASNQPLPTRQPLPGVPDLSATLSESYLNAEIAREAKSNPLSIAGIVSLKDIVIKILPNEQIQVDVKVGNALVDFDVSVLESIGVVNGQIAVRAIGEPKVGKGNLPVNVNTVVQVVNTTIVEPQINNNVATIKVNERLLRLLDLQTANGQITVRYRAQ